MEDRNYFLTQVVQRYDSRLESLQKFLYDKLHLKGLNKPFIFAVVNAFDEREFLAEDFEPFSIDNIVDYIQRTHSYYLDKQLPELTTSVEHLLVHYDPKHPLVYLLKDFVERYTIKLKNHFLDEETHLLPYIALLHKTKNSMNDLSKFYLKHCNYSISMFSSDHDHVDDELKVVLKTIKLYHPPTADIWAYRTLLAQLRTFKRDLEIHEYLEELVLIPKAKILEESHLQKVIDIVIYN